MLKLRNIHLFILCALLTLVGCTTPDHDSEATALGDALLDLAINNRGKALQRVDSAAEAGVFTAVQACGRCGDTRHCSVQRPELSRS